MKKKDCNFIFEWDFESMFSPDSLITKINQTSANINQKSLMGGADTLEIHSDLLGLISSLEYYNKEKKILGGRYEIKINDENEKDLIFVIKHQVLNDFDKIPSVIPSETHPGFSDVIYKPIDLFSEDEINEYKKLVSGCVIIKNYK